MSARPVAIHDANVLYPAQLRDLLIRLAVAGLVRAHWSDRIHEEWMDNVQNRVRVSIRNSGHYQQILKRYTCVEAQDGID